MEMQQIEEEQEILKLSLLLTCLYLKQGSLLARFKHLNTLEEYGFIQQPQKGRRKIPTLVSMQEDGKKAAEEILSKIDLAELIAIWKKIDREKNFMQWGNWTFDARLLTLTHMVESYEIDLEEIRSSADILDWIFQILGKEWGDAATIYDLLVAFEDILHPQTNYCSFGQNKQADGGTLAKQFIDKVRKR